MRCTDIPDLLDAYLADTLDEPRRNAVRGHLRACERCRAAAVDADPSLLFVAAAPGPPDPVRVEDTARAVIAQVRQQRMQRRLGHRRPWLAAAAAVVLSLVTVAGWRLLAPGSGPDDAGPDAARVAETPSPPPRIEVDMAGEGVRVYQYADQQDSDTAVTFIVNPELEL
ncbi:MAG TPA: zf-HC2 domain-containing protein [Thermoanaerobaculales bacterium]|nr:zf-HC2 domain-containing protein [Thermoanaerobaculales bacterium]HPA79266.1 zf-HC2 domain-containing protein [Thermoanaerobaculales bacterium]HQL31171.1 zf-HC2 domain-containing protein [Thermoanaerobaculales bacterium]HQN95972.1 zf-HC2 domain-containing protein [Thermoanaerobaculales bacterium]HQP42787.1 zf-HC2 domain-containing protein [Thermoanaerobaculales bacterium]